MINIKSNKGITLVSLVVTVIILLILSGTVIYNINLSDNVGEYNNMVSDIELLKNKILIYYNNNYEIPKVDNKSIIIDGIKYYEIDLKKLGNITLNYGSKYGNEENLTTTSDVYVVSDTLDVYYLKGVKKSGEIFHKK